MMPNKLPTNSNKQKHEMANNKVTAANKDQGQQQQQQQQQQQLQNQQKHDNILNVAEMLLHGVKDDEILDIWLKSISCPEFVVNFIDAGYDMPTISRITPQDLTAIGITDPTKRLKILTEIKKLNLQDGIPSFKPANLSHWLSLIRLDSSYYKSLCDQQVDTIEKMCQLTWEDFEELGINKLGHQKRLQLAIERMKELEADEKKTSKPMSEPIYDTNPSQILLVASAENHSMNGPIIAKQSSTSELSSTGSGSMHSVYSANSSHYQPSYASLHTQNQQRSQDQLNGSGHQMNQQKQQPIYSQPPSQISANQQQIQHPITPSTTAINGMLSSPNHRQSLSHYQSVQSQMISVAPAPPQSIITSLANDNQSLGSNICAGNRNTMVPQTHRQSLGQLPFSALANLPKHQQQLLQQSSIYATLSRQPQRAKQPPPPVPIRTNSLKSNSLIDEPATISATNQSQQQANNNQYQPQQMNNFHTISSSSLFRSGTRVSSRNSNNGNNISQQYTSQTMLSKNKSFSGNAHMEAIRARFLNRNSQHQFANLPQQIQSIMNHNTNNNNNINRNKEQQQASIMYGMQPNRQMNCGINEGNHFANGHFATNEAGDGDHLYNQRQSVLSTIATPTHPNLYGNNNINQHLQQIPNQAQFVHPQSTSQQQQQQQQQPTLITGPGMIRNAAMGHSNDDYDLQSDTNSTKSLIIGSSGFGDGGCGVIGLSSAINSPVDSSNQARLNDNSSQDSGSSQTLYNSASSGSSSNEHNLNNLHNKNNLSSSSSRPGDIISRHSTTSSSTLNDVNIALDQTNSTTTTTNPSLLNQQQQIHQRPNNLTANSFSITATSSYSSSTTSSSSSSSTSSSSTSAAIKNSPSSSSTVSNGGPTPATTNTTSAANRNHPGGDSFNATTGKDDDFPPPPSPLSLTDSDEPDLVSLNSDSNFTDISHGLMTFRVGT